MLLRKLLSIIAFSFVSSAAISQSSFPPIDKSPMDMAYYPSNYPSLKVQRKASDSLVARVIYSRPTKEGRTIYGGLVPYGQVWRLGANEATELDFFRPVTIGNKKIAPGRYTLYALVNEKSWTFIVNKETDIWGSFVYDVAKDIVRVEVPVETATQPLEALAMTFVKNNNNFDLVVAWDNLKATLPISLQ